MRNDERYRQKPMSSQLEIFGLGADGEQDMADARAWIGEHPRAWDFMVEQATRLNRKGYVSINYLIHMAKSDEAFDKFMDARERLAKWIVEHAVVIDEALTERKYNRMLNEEVR